MERWQVRRVQGMGKDRRVCGREVDRDVREVEGEVWDDREVDEEPMTEERFVREAMELLCGPGWDEDDEGCEDA